MLPRSASLLEVTSFCDAGAVPWRETAGAFGAMELDHNSIKAKGSLGYLWDGYLLISEFHGCF